jgi:beta-lactamase superfamily II metal-dependent hydrolase
MSAEGFEIDFIGVGDADSILITKWTDSVPIRVLIDGGYGKDAKKVGNFLKQRRATFVDHLVCSHLHDDHAAGLVKLVEDETFTFGKAWVHIPRNHINMRTLNAALGSTQNLETSIRVTASLRTIVTLEQALLRRGIEIEEPFQGDQIGPLTVLGPSVEYYRENMAKFRDIENIKLLEAEATRRLEISAASADEDNLLENPDTEPENNCCTILGAVFDTKRYLFTADAGAQALELARAAYQFNNLHWMQIPHHGSKRNITNSLIEKFSPRVAFVSCEGNAKHPSQAVVNAFKKVGAKVYSTHYPSPGNKWHHRGDAPERPSYSSAKALWD